MIHSDVIQDRVDYSENLDSAAELHRQTCTAALATVAALTLDAQRQLRELVECCRRLGIDPGTPPEVLAQILPEAVPAPQTAQTPPEPSGRVLSNPTQSNGHARGNGRKPARK